MKQLDPRSLPPCALSAQCLRLIDELDSSHSPDQTSNTLDDESNDQQLLEQLHAHIPTCPTCTATLAWARRVRAQQRAALRDFLADSEQLVPSTTAQIIAAIRREQASPQQANRPSMNNHHRAIDQMPTQQLLEEMPVLQLRSASRPRPANRLRTALALVAAAILLIGTFSLLGRFILINGLQSSHGTTPTTTNKPTPGSPASSTPGATPSQLPSATPTSTGNQQWDGWNTITFTSGPGSNGLVAVSNADYQNGIPKLVNSNSGTISGNARFDGIPSDGHDVLYQVENSGHTLYYALNTPMPNTGFFYELNDFEAGNAIWADSSNVLISTMHLGVLKANIHTGLAVVLTPLVKGATLLYTRPGFIYFVAGEQSTTPGIYRLDLTTGKTNVLMSGYSTDPTVLLSPDGSTVYYVDTSSSGKSGTYAVNSDGTNPRLLSQDAKPIGYAADNSLMLMREVNGIYQIVKWVDKTKQEQLVLDNVVPGATSLCGISQASFLPSICESNIALAPYGHAVAVLATYADGTHKLWSVDLITAQRIEIQTNDLLSINLLGWSRMAV